MIRNSRSSSLATPGVLFAFLVVFLVCLGSDSPVCAQSNGWEEVFYEANQAYKEGRYQEAAQGYEKLLTAGYGNGHIHYNLGNAYLRQDDLGRAILSYERARLLMPRDADLLFNLRYAADQRQDAVADQKNLAGAAFFWLDSLNLHELFWTFAAANALFWMILAARLFNKSDATYYLLFSILIFWAISGISFGLKQYQAATDDRAVVLPKEASIFAGPDEKDTVLFRLHAGTIVHGERLEDGWCLVRLSGDKRGWTKAGDIEQILKKERSLPQAISLRQD